jgi:hypothetical protein
MGDHKAWAVSNEIRAARAMAAHGALRYSWLEVRCEWRPHMRRSRRRHELQGRDRDSGD